MLVNIAASLIRPNVKLRLSSGFAGDAQECMVQISLLVESRTSLGLRGSFRSESGFDKLLNLGSFCDRLPFLNNPSNNTCPKGPCTHTVYTVVLK